MSQANESRPMNIPQAPKQVLFALGSFNEPAGGHIGPCKRRIGVPFLGRDATPMRLNTLS